MKDQLGKLVELLPWLVSHPGSSLAETAMNFELTEKQLLNLLQIAVFTGPGQGGGELVDIDFEDAESLFVANAQGLDRPVKFSAETASIALAGLQLLLQLPGIASNDVVQELIYKLQKGFDLPDGLIAVAPNAELERFLPAIQQAIAGELCLEITYANGATGAVSKRIIEPKRITQLETGSYVEAFCNAALDQRLFRLDRIAELTILDRKHSNLVDNSDQISVDPLSISITVSCTKNFRSNINSDLITSQQILENGDLEIELQVHNLDWIAREILASCGELMPLEPLDLVVLVKDKIQAHEQLSKI